MYKKGIGKVLISAPPPQKVKGNFTKNMRKKIEKNCSHLAGCCGSRIRKAFYYTHMYTLGMESWKDSPVVSFVHTGSHDEDANSEWCS